MNKKMRDLRALLSRMDDYVVAPKEKRWFSTPFEAFAGMSFGAFQSGFASMPARWVSTSCGPGCRLNQQCA